MSNRNGGILSVQVDGEVYQVVGDWTTNLGSPMREALVGSDSVHGYKELPQVPFVEGTMRDRRDLDRRRLTTIANATVTVALPNGKLFSLYEAWFAGEGSGTTENAELSVRFEGLSAEEILP